MQYTVVAETDVGTRKKTNQDSLLVKHGRYDGGEILLAIICDGMGGFDKGEVASATVIKEFNDWFDDQFPYELSDLNLEVIAGKWELMLKDLNSRIMDYGRGENIKLGTTFTGVLFIEDQYICMHVGDTRLYYIKDMIQQITDDQTVVAREIDRGTMTLEAAEHDARRNVLLQCVGASEHIEPQFIISNVSEGSYLLCSDGFRHKITSQEIYEQLNPSVSDDAMNMRRNVRSLINKVKRLKEDDNISAILMKAE